MNDNNNKNEKPKSGEQLTPKELTKKHLENPNHVISDEEIGNLNIDPDADKSLQQKEKEKLDELKNDTDKDLPNPYDVLGG